MTDLGELFRLVRFDRIDVVEYSVKRQVGDALAHLPVISADTSDVQLEIKVEVPPKGEGGFLAYTISARLDYSAKGKDTAMAEVLVALRVVLSGAPHDIGEAQIRAIGDHVAKFQVWPFLRERLHSASDTLGAAILLPLLVRNLPFERPRPQEAPPG